MPGSSPRLVRPRRILVVANPAAGGGRRAAAGDAVARAVGRAGLVAELRRTERAGDAEAFAEHAAASGFDLVVAVGGDGTVHQAANGAAGRGAALAVAPAGTMNLLARVLGLPLDPVLAVERILDGYHPLALAPGSAAGRIFLLMAGAGFDAWVLRELLSGHPATVGFGDYVRGALRGLRTFPFPDITVRHDGGAVVAHTAILGRAPLYGGFLRPTPHARLDVDRLELCAFSGGAAGLATIVPRLWSGAHAGCDGVTLKAVSNVALTATRRDVPYQLDGELAGTLPVEIGLSRRILVLASSGRMP